MLVEAFNKVPIIQRLPEQITAMDSWANALMVGTKQGNVHIYSVTPHETDSREFKVKIVFAIKMRKPIMQLRLLPKINCLLILSDHVISVYDIRTYQLIKCLNKTRGTVAFTVDQSLLSSTGKSANADDPVLVDAEGEAALAAVSDDEGETALLRTRLAVSTKRRVLVFETYSDWSKLSETHNLMIPDARVLLFFGQALYLANKSDYLAVRLSNCEIFDLFSVGASEPGIFLISTDTVGFLQDQKMALVSPRQNMRVSPAEYSRVVAKLNWSEAPTAVLPASWPYLLALLPSCVEVRVRESRQLVQQEMFERPRHLCPQAAVPPEPGDGPAPPRLTSLQRRAQQQQPAAGRRTHSVNGPQPPANVISAAAVYVASTDSVWRLVGVDRVRQVQQLMDRKEYDLAWQLAGTVPVPEALDRVLPVREIGVMHAFTLFAREHRFEEAFDILGTLRVDPSHVVGLLRSGLLPEEYQSKIRYPGELPRLGEEEAKKAMRALMGYLLAQRNILLSAGASAQPGEMYHPIMPQSISIAARPLHLRQVIDTSLFKCYLFTKQDTLLESFLRLPDNACHFEETEHTLKQQQRYNDLLVLYESRGDHRKALKFLLAQSQKAGSLLYGPLPTVRYLQKLGPKNWDVICEFSKWVLERHPEDGLRIFTDYASEPLPRWRVFEFLHEAAPRQVIPYLEHVTGLPEEESDMSHEELVRFHNKLGDELILLAKSLAEDSVRGLPESQQALHLSGHGHTPRAADAATHREVMAVRQKLQDFLETSTLYTPRKLLINYPVDCYFEERALLYARMGRLRDALALWVHVLEQPERAELVAAQAFEAPEVGTESRSAYLLLMEVCLAPPTPAQLEIMMPASSATSTPEAEAGNGRSSFPVCLEYGLKVLERHGTKIDAAKAVALLPESVNLSAVLSYLKTALEAKERKRRHQELQRQLCYAELLQQQEKRMACRARRIELGADEMCSVCKKRLGASSAFGRYPDGRLAHYACCAEFRV